MIEIVLAILVVLCSFACIVLAMGEDESNG